MLAVIRDHAEQPRLVSTAEKASWMVVIAAEQLAGEQPDRFERTRYAEVARRMTRAIRLGWSDDQALCAASPTFTGADGRSHSLVEAVGRFHDDPAIGIRAALMCFQAFDWRLDADKGRLDHAG